MLEALHLDAARALEAPVKDGSKCLGPLEHFGCDLDQSGLCGGLDLGQLRIMHLDHGGTPIRYAQRMRYLWSLATRFYVTSWIPVGDSIEQGDPLRIDDFALYLWGPDVPDPDSRWKTRMED